MFIRYIKNHNIFSTGYIDHDEVVGYYRYTIRKNGINIRYIMFFRHCIDKFRMYITSIIFIDSNIHIKLHCDYPPDIRTYTNNATIIKYWIHKSPYNKAAYYIDYDEPTPVKYYGAHHDLLRKLRTIHS